MDMAYGTAGEKSRSANSLDCLLADEPEHLCPYFVNLASQSSISTQ